ncbi:glycosyltransferase family 4 protein [Thermoproteus tenax]|uniref:LPS biosynthesis glycosyltransferase n=1 Tax=Thermoproteus tenax (strain ATCC 35583 / DSM 2078 / JCM 9277 / NBRC 100435 / Kra 1) TaxID=768679 RepID=G4RKA5_THETK|nr:glycosyltransferase family 4 protein [Thermoproteus tenax]CCC82000.1 LPS biosynthesis glycosyltransferase [Thermoproteus tenax Kra 1]
MKIIHIAPFYAPVIGGMEEVVKRVAEHLARDNEVYVVTYNRLRKGGRGKLPREEEINGVKVIRLKPTLIWSHGTYSEELPQAIKRLRPDVVHVHAWRHPHVFQTAKLKDKLGFRAILHPHAPYHTMKQVGIVTWTYYKFIDTFLKNVLTKYDKIIALTPHEEKTLTEIGVGEGKIVVIPHGIDEGIIDQNNIKDEATLLYVGRISKAKNLDLLIKAMKHINKQVKDARLIVAGPDEGLAQDIVRQARKNSLKIEYLGVVGEEAKHELYRKAAVLTHPAIYEPFGITLLEAQAHGTPCVITGRGGQIYAAPPGRTSLYAEPDPVKYAEGVVELITNKDLHRTLSNNAVEWARQHTWSRIMPMYKKLYQEIAQR